MSGFFPEPFAPRIRSALRGAVVGVQVQASVVTQLTINASQFLVLAVSLSATPGASAGVIADGGAPSIQRQLDAPEILGETNQPKSIVAAPGTHAVQTTPADSPTIQRTLQVMTL